MHSGCGCRRVLLMVTWSASEKLLIWVYETCCARESGYLSASSVSDDPKSGIAIEKVEKMYGRSIFGSDQCLACSLLSSADWA